MAEHPCKSSSGTSLSRSLSFSPSLNDLHYTFAAPSIKVLLSKGNEKESLKLRHCFTFGERKWEWVTKIDW
jgi:hypothetical protein